MRLFGPKNRHGLVIASTRSRCLFLFSPATSAFALFPFLRPPASCAFRRTFFQPRSLPTDSPATMHHTLAPAHTCPPSSAPHSPPRTTVTPLRQSSSQTCRPSTSSLPRSHKRAKSTRQSLGGRPKREASIPMACLFLLGRRAGIVPLTTFATYSFHNNYLHSPFAKTYCLKCWLKKRLQPSLRHSSMPPTPLLPL